MERNTNIHIPETFPENVFIRQIWSTNDILLNRRTEKVLPKGTVEIIFNLLDDAYCYKSKAENAFKLPKYFINGVNFSPVNLVIKNRQYFVGIQLNIFALRYIFDIPGKEFNDRVCEGSLVCKSLEVLADRLEGSGSFYEQIGYINQWFRSKIKNFEMREVKSRIIKLHSDASVINLSVKDISEKYNITPRHLSRLCLEYFGMCTEDLILYKKYLSSLQHIHQSTESLTNISYDCCFYDQSHFVRTFKSFTGLTPSQYRKSVGTLPGHIFSEDEDNEDDFKKEGTKRESLIISV